MVFTGPGLHGDRWGLDDSTMLTDVTGVEVVRAGGPVPLSENGLEARINRMIGRRGVFVRWWIDSVKRFELAPGQKIDVILGELGPYETSLGVEKLAARLGVPWVADLQDPWALDEMRLYPTALHRLADRKRMRSTLRSAAAVVMNTPEAAARLLIAFPELRRQRVVSITNGFDAKDFGRSVPEREDGAFRIVHSGSLHTDLAQQERTAGRIRRRLGGMPVPTVDFRTRSHVYLMEAVDEVLRTDPSLQRVVEVHLVGATTDADRQAAARYPFVHFHGQKSHAEAVSLLRTADLLFLPMQDLPVGVRAGLVPGKTYEYIASGTPILAAVPDGDAREILLSVGTATVCRPADVDCLVRALRERIQAWRHGAPRPRPDPAVVAQFEARNLTSVMAGLLHEAATGATSGGTPHG